MSISDSVTLNKKVFTLKTITGSAMAPEQNSETIVTQSGGGVTIGSAVGGLGTAVTTKPKTTSRTINTLSFWLQADDGKQQHFEFTGSKLPIMEGQTISITMASLNGDDYPCQITNHASGDSTFLASDAAFMRAIFNFEGLKLFVIALVVAFILYSLNFSWVVVVLLFLAISPFTYIFKAHKAEKELKRVLKGFSAKILGEA